MALSSSPEVVALRRRMSSLKNGVATNGTTLHAIHIPEDELAGGNEGESSDGVSHHSYVSEGSTSPDRSKDRVDEESPEGGRRLHDDAEDTIQSHSLRTTPRVKRTFSSSSRIRRGRQTRQVSERSKTGDSDSNPWFSYNLSIVVALISPIGNWLTGGDHIKNVLLILLLIFYLHQLIEVPWALYRASVPRLQLPLDGEEARVEDTLFRSVHTELRTLELAYLALSVLAPFLGATLLRSVSHAITGDERTLSWFSTALFVLATGIRPWTHLVSRLKNRSEALNDILNSEARYDTEVEEEELAMVEESLADVRENVRDVENKLGRVNARNNREVDALHERIEEVAESVTKLEKLTQKHQGEMNKTIAAQNARLLALETQFATSSYLTQLQFGQSSSRTAGWRRSLRKLRSTFWYYMDALPAYLRHSGRRSRKGYSSSSASSSPTIGFSGLHHRKPSPALNGLNLTLPSIPEEQQIQATLADEYAHETNSMASSTTAVANSSAFATTSESDVPSLAHFRGSSTAVVHRLIYFFFFPVIFTFRVAILVFSLPISITRSLLS